nr:ABC transporter ATP-binding protein [Candidatus Saccharibacteria bacterium]
MDIEMQAVRKNAFFSLFEDISSPLIEVGTRIWAILLVAGGKLAFDQFLFVIGLIQQASSQTFILGYNISRAQETYLATAALKDVMDIPDAPDGTEKIQIGGGGIAIELRDISLKYQNGTQALKNVTLSISAGQKVAIVGENGAGKTSLLRIIAKQYEPTEGTLIINGIATKQLSRESLYKHTSVLSQDYYLFDDLTIKQNLEVVAGRTLTKDDILAALDVVHLKQKILSLPHQLDTRLDKSYKDGADLSGGQRQRLSIARTLLKPFDLLILDEPTSAIDAKAERSIFNSIFEKSASATVLIVSHRFATVRKADYIYVVDDGHIIEQGTHKELMAQNGHYAELYTIQAQDFMD